MEGYLQAKLLYLLPLPRSYRAAWMYLRRFLAPLLLGMLILAVGAHTASAQGGVRSTGAVPSLRMEAMLAAGQGLDQRIGLRLAHRGEVPSGLLRYRLALSGSLAPERPSVSQSALDLNLTAPTEHMLRLGIRAELGAPDYSHLQPRPTQPVRTRSFKHVWPARIQPTVAVEVFDGLVLEAGKTHIFWRCEGDKWERQVAYKSQRALMLGGAWQPFEQWSVTGSVVRPSLSNIPRVAIGRDITRAYFLAAGLHYDTPGYRIGVTLADSRMLSETGAHQLVVKIGARVRLWHYEGMQGR